MMTWLQALTFTSVPKITVVIRKAWGMAAANMCGPSAGADFIAGLTTADIRSMSPEAAMNMVYQHRIEEAEDPEAEREKLIKEMESQSTPWEAAAAGLLDDIIDPRDTRMYIINSLDILRGQRGDFIGSHQLQTWPCGF